MKKIKRNAIFILIILVVILYFVMKDNFNEIVNELWLANKWWILLAVALMFSYWLLRSLSLFLIAREYKGKLKYSVIFRQILITQFFNGITPFATGGEPMQVYMLHKNGIRVGNATNIIVQEFIMYQIALIFIGLASLILNFSFNLLTLKPLHEKLIFLGFFINIAIGLFLIFVSFSKKFSRFVVKCGIKLGTWLRIVKDVNKTKEAWNERVEEYNESGTMLKENKLLFCKCVLINVLSLVIYYLIPYFVFLSLGEDLRFMEVFVCSSFILIIGNFVPLPGGSGGTEYAFSLFFDTFIPVGPIVSSGLIIWRSITYYLGIIVGSICLGFFKESDREKLLEEV